MAGMSPTIPIAPESWTVLDHGALEPCGDGLWTISGALPNMALPRTAVIARHVHQGTSGLVVHSAISVNDAVLADILAQGTPRWLVVPNGLHRLDAPAWKARFPDIQVLCPPAAREAVEQVVPVDAVFDESDDRFGADTGISFRPWAGVGGKEWAMLVHHASGEVSVVVTDAIFNLPHQPGFGGLILRMMGSSGGPKVTFLARRLMLDNAAELAADIRAVAKIEGLKRLVPAHGEVVDRDVAAVLQTVADNLSR